MTLTEFRNDVTWWGDLRSFCMDNGFYEDADAIFSDEDRDYYLNDELSEYASGRSWWDLRDFLDSIPTGSDWWIMDDYGEWIDADDDDIFQRHKDVVERMALENGYFDPEEEEETAEEPDTAEPEEDEEPPVEEDFGVSELFVDCSAVFQSVSVKSAEEPQECEDWLNDLSLLY